MQRNPDWTLLESVLPAGSWAGHPAVCVASGPSMIGFDYSKIGGMKSIGVNREFEFFDPTIMLWADTNFYRWLMKGEYGQEALKKFREFKNYKAWLLSCELGIDDGIFAIPMCRDYVYSLNNFSMNLSEGICHGNNTGYAALNLAYLLGASPIYLLGYDMGSNVPGRVHHHSGHPTRHSKQVFEGFAKIYGTAAKCINDPERVINLNPQSNLKCFKFQRREEVFG